MMKSFIDGLKSGVNANPLAFFAPVIAIWRLLLECTESLINKPASRK